MVRQRVVEHPPRGGGGKGGGGGKVEGRGGLRDCASVREELGVRGDGGGRKGKASAAKHEISLVGGKSSDSSEKDTEEGGEGGGRGGGERWDGVEMEVVERGTGCGRCGRPPARVCWISSTRVARLLRLRQASTFFWCSSRARSESTSAVHEPQPQNNLTLIN